MMTAGDLAWVWRDREPTDVLKLITKGADGSPVVRQYAIYDRSIFGIIGNRGLETKGRLLARLAADESQPDIVELPPDIEWVGRWIFRPVTGE